MAWGPGRLSIDHVLGRTFQNHQLWPKTLISDAADSGGEPIHAS
jgi:hypothetical protein